MSWLTKILVWLLMVLLAIREIARNPYHDGDR